MKKVYQKPDLEVIAFESEDVITTSFVDVLPGPGMGDGNEGETDFE